MQVLISPPSTGDYQLYISSAGASELLLSEGQGEGELEVIARVLSSQVDDMTAALESARTASAASASSLEGLTGRAEGVAQRLELLVASMHDLPVDDQKPHISEEQEAEVIGLDKTVFQSRRVVRAAE